MDRDVVQAAVITGCQPNSTSPCTNSFKDSVSLRDGDKERDTGSVERVENNHIPEEQKGASISDQEVFFESELL